MKFIKIKLLFFIIFLLLGGCTKSQKEKTPLSENKTVTRTIILSPAITEMFLFLDEKWSAENIIGISDFTLNKEKLKHAVLLGNIYNLSFEKILSLYPMQIIIQGSNEKLLEFCNKYKIKLFKIKIESIDDITRTMQFSKNIIQSKIAQKQFTSWKNKLNKYRLSYKEKNFLKKNNLNQKSKTSAKNNKRKKVLLIVHRLKEDASLILTTNRNTFLSQALSLAGYQNIINTKKLWPKLSLEEILVLNPDVIIELSTQKKIIHKLNNKLKKSLYKIIYDKNILMPSHTIIKTIKLFNKILM